MNKNVFVILAISAMLFVGCLGAQQGSQATPVTTETTPIPSYAAATVAGTNTAAPTLLGAGTSKPSATPVSSPTTVPSYGQPSCRVTSSCFIDDSGRCMSSSDQATIGPAVGAGQRCICSDHVCILSDASTPGATQAPTAVPTAASTVMKITSVRAANIRINRAELYWNTNLNSTATIFVGNNPTSRATNSVAAWDTHHFWALDSLNLNTTYYFEIEACNGTNCAKTPTLNFTTPSSLETPIAEINFTLS